MMLNLKTIKKVLLLLILLFQYPWGWGIPDKFIGDQRGRIFREPYAHAITNSADIKDIGVDEKLGDYIPLGLTFRDEQGKVVKLRDFFQDGRPVVLTLNYYECPMLCTYVLNGVLEAVNELRSFSLGQDFKIVTVSFNPAETPELAKKKAANYYKALRNGASQKDWHFLTGDEENISKLTQAVGFSYKKDGKEFAHPSTIVILTPQGEIARYLYGIQYEPHDLKLALIEASEGKIGSSKILNDFLLYCYHFDPVGKKYALRAINIMKAGGVLTLLVVGGLLTYFWRREKMGKTHDT